MVRLTGFIIFNEKASTIKIQQQKMRDGGFNLVIYKNILIRVYERPCTDLTIPLFAGTGSRVVSSTQDDDRSTVALNENCVWCLAD